MSAIITLHKEESGIYAATVRSGDGAGRMLVSGPEGLVAARRADGCLLLPETGDTVLAARLEDGQCWVLSVLTKKSPKGRLELPARTTLSAAMLTLQAPVMVMKNRVFVHMADSVRTLAGRLLEVVGLREGRYGKTRDDIGDLAQKRCGRMRLDCREGVRVRSENTDIKAQKNLDLDAEHITVG